MTATLGARWVQSVDQQPEQSAWNLSLRITFMMF